MAFFSLFQDLSGKPKSPDAVLSTLDKLAKALRVSVSDLYEVLPEEVSEAR
jgi:DNA-binding Xre family transcriptional regulator